MTTHFIILERIMQKKKNRGEKIKKKRKERKEERFSRAIWELYRDHTRPNKKVPTEVIPPIARKAAFKT